MITKNGNKLETQVYRKPTHTGFLRNISKTSARVSSGFQTRETFEIDHLTVVGLMTWPLNGSEAGVDLVLIQTSLFLLCKSSCSYAN